MEGGTGVFYQAMPAVGPEGKNVMKLIPVHKVNGQFLQVPSQPERNHLDFQLKACAKPVHPPCASSSQTQPRMPSFQATTDRHRVLNAPLEFTNLPKPVKPPQAAAKTVSSHAPTTVQLSPMAAKPPVQLPNCQSTLATQTQPVTVKSPVLPNGHMLQIPPDATVRTIPTTALPQSIKCHILNSVTNSPNNKAVPTTVVLVSPVDSVKLHATQPLVSPPKPGLIEKSQSPKPVKTPIVPKTNEDGSALIKWLIQEGTGASSSRIVPIPMSNVNESTANKTTPPQTEQETITPGKDNALVLCNGKVYFVAKGNSEIAKAVFTSEEGKRGSTNTYPVLPASSAMMKFASEIQQKKLTGEIIDLCDDDEVAPTHVGGGSGNQPSLVEVYDSDEESNVIFVSYIPPKTRKKVTNSTSGKTGAKTIELSFKPANQNKTHAQIENGDKQVDEGRMGEQDMGNEGDKKDKNLENSTKEISLEALEMPPEIVLQGGVTVPIREHPSAQALEDAEKDIEISTRSDRRVKSDHQWRKEFGVVADVQVCLQRTNLSEMKSPLVERPLINKRTLDGLRKVIQESNLKSKINQLLQAPHTITEDEEALKAKRKKQVEDEADVPTSSAPKISSIPVSNPRQEKLSEPFHSESDDAHLHTQSSKPKSPVTANHPVPARRCPPRSKKSKVCTACPCGTILGTDRTSPQQKLSVGADVTPHKGTRKCSLNKSPPVQTLESKQTLRTPHKDFAPLECDDNFSEDLSKDALSGSPPPSCLQVTNLQTEQTDSSRINTDALVDNPSVPAAPTGVTFAHPELFSLDAEEIKRREKIKRLKDLLKEKEAALERMQRSMDL
ncbi:hypothetical protein DNTS_020504 [Danionella cerebrum]|uniref:Ligand-dependent nuclear receptor-interacting factor 1 n=1 Tax=Danionella cerebrum TaxID=2873325 RepID=A0A553QJ02_9TELE|nr:hypothetical protein DNTS_020504 [Danionella translucida]